MKRHTMIVALVLMAMPMVAERVTPETAQKVAKTFLNNNGAKANNLTDLSKAAGFPNLYIFNGNPGFVVMSADDCIQPILGYSLTGVFITEDMPENVRGWLQGYNDQIQDMVESRMKASSDISRQWKDLENGTAVLAKTRNEVGPLISTKWDQTYPYNYYCPTCSSYGNGGHVYTGCVATAMAQVIKYHNYPEHGIGSHSYTHATYGLQTANFGETDYDWSNMPEKIYSNSSSDYIQAVAKLIYHCGVAVEMDYGNRGSGAYSNDIAPALKNYFGFSQTTNYISRNDYEDDDNKWIDTIRAELDALRPVIYGGMDHPTNPTSGHSFVCDGYGKDGYSNYYFNFNWGWSGSYNGYFSIDNMTPGGDGAGGGNHNYSYLQDAIIGIKPASCNTSEPTNLAYSADGRNITLTWNKVTSAASYSVYRNSTIIGTAEQNNSGETVIYLDQTVPYGTNTYYVRSVDTNGELSMPSNYVSITLTFPAPTNLTAQNGENGIELSWEAESALAYNVYCNDILIASNLTVKSFTDQRLIAGTLVYYVRGIDSFGDESEISNTATVTIPYRTPIVTDLGASSSGENVTLSWTAPEWCYPQSDASPLTYGSGDISYGWSFIYYAHKHDAATMIQYANKNLYKVTAKVSYAGTYTAYIYIDTKDGNPDPDALATNCTLICQEGQTGWKEFVFSQPVLIPEDKDLWIVIKQEGTGKDYPVPSFNYGSHYDNACYYSMSSPTQLYPVDEQYTISWFIRAYLTDGTYTYHLYDNGASVADDIATTSYVVSSPANNTAHQYTIKTNYYGSESAASNMAGLTIGNASLSSLEMTSNDKMTITENSTLSVNGTLSNSNPKNLIIENGAQLIHNSNGVAATVKKDIVSYNNGGGWNFIASPTTDSITPSADNGFLANDYDLYYYDEPTSKWRNHKPAQDNEDPGFKIAPQKGYLYASENGTTLNMTGILRPSHETVTISGLSHEASTLTGFNLIGNPFACNATLGGNDFYIIDNTTKKVVLAETGRTIAPCEGVFVKAISDDFTVNFSKYTGAKVHENGNCLDLVVNRDRSIIDRARVRFGDGTNMEKFSLDNDNSSQLSFWQDGQENAVVYAADQSEMPVNFKAAKNGTYTISIEANSLDLDYLHLIDNMTGADVDLLTTSSYTFEAKTNDYESRFRLVFTANVSNEANNEAFACYSHGLLQVSNEGEAQLQIVDMTGRILLSETVHDNFSKAINLNEGIYIMRLIAGSETKTQKMVVQ